MVSEIHGIPLYVEGGVDQEEQDRYVALIGGLESPKKNADKIHHMEVGSLAHFWFKDGKLITKCDRYPGPRRQDMCEGCEDFVDLECSTGNFKGYVEKQPRYRDLMLNTMMVLRVVLVTEGVTEYGEPKPPEDPPEPFKPTTENYPLPGDLITGWGFNDCLIKEDRYGVIQGTEDEPKEVYDVCFNPMGIFRAGHVSASGGPGKMIRGDELEFTHKLIDVQFWKWKTPLPGRDNGEYFTKKVRVFKLKEERK